VGDPTITLRTKQGRESYIGRITAQVSARHRVSYNQEYQRRCEGSTLRLDSDDGCNTRGADWVAVGAGNALISPEANNLYFGNLPYHVNQAIWTAPMTNKLLLEAGFTRFMFRGGTTGRPAPDGITDLIQVTEQSTGDQSGHGPAVRAAGKLCVSWPVQLEPQLRQPEQLARLGLVRHRVARDEGRLSGLVYPRQKLVLR
jgi:hypothetical protein